MFISRGFVAELIDGTGLDANVVLTLGNVSIPFFQLKSGATMPTARIESGLDADISWISTYIDEPTFLGTLIGYNNATGSYPDKYTTFVNRLLSIAPKTLITDVSGAVNDRFYLRLRNSTGYYLRSVTKLSFSSFGGVSMRMFDNTGAVIGGGAAFPVGFNVFAYYSGATPYRYTGNCKAGILVSAFDSDGNIAQNATMCSIACDVTSADSSTLSKKQYAINAPESATIVTAVRTFFNSTVPFPPEQTDPYANLDTPGDDPIPGGGTVGIPGFPGLTATSAGVIGLFAPTASQMQQLADFMWTDFGGTATDVFEVLQELVEAVKRSISNPLDYIIGLNIIPSQGLSIGSNKVVRFGFVSSGVSMPQLANQYFTVDCGSLSFDTLCGDTFLDYAPYSKFSIYLPYIGFKDVDPNDFVGHTIGVVYHGDVVTGGVTAYITKDGSVMYQYSGCCALNVPLSADNWGETISAAINVATGIVAAAASGGAAGVATAAAKGAANVAANPSLLSPQVSHSGAVSGGAGCMGVQYPFVIREAVNFHSTAGFNKSTGYPAYYYKQLADVSGFTTVIEAHMNNIPMATQDEIQEIESLLESGVIL